METLLTELCYLFLETVGEQIVEGVALVLVVSDRGHAARGGPRGPGGNLPGIVVEAVHAITVGGVLLLLKLININKYCNDYSADAPRS